MCGVTTLRLVAANCMSSVPGSWGWRLQTWEVGTFQSHEHWQSTPVDTRSESLERQEFLEVMSVDQRAGVWPVEEGGSSSSSGPAVPEDVEESEPVKNLVAPTAPTATCRAEHMASGHAVFGTWCRKCCIGRSRMHQHRAGGRETTIPAVATDHGYLSERGDLLQEAAGAAILVSKCNRDRWIGAAIVPTKGADEYAVAELKNDVICSGFTEVPIRLDDEPAILAMKESAATALRLAGVNVLRRVHCSTRKATYITPWRW